MKAFNPLRKKGFTLVETMITVSIIGLLASICLPTFNTARQTSVATRLANDYRTYAAAFEIYATENGHWPADVNRGVIPPGMEGALPKFADPSYGDGRWDWDFQSTRVEAGISLKGGRLDNAVFAKIDSILDDGDLSTGRFISTSSGATYVLQF